MLKSLRMKILSKTSTFPYGCLFFMYEHKAICMHFEEHYITGYNIYIFPQRHTFLSMFTWSRERQARNVNENGWNGI